LKTSRQRFQQLETIDHAEFTCLSTYCLKAQPNELKLFRKKRDPVKTLYLNRAWMDFWGHRISVAMKLEPVRKQLIVPFRSSCKNR